MALDLIVKHVKRKLKELGMNFREQLLNAHQGERMPDTLYVLPATNQIKVCVCAMGLCVLMLPTCTTWWRAGC